MANKVNFPWKLFHFNHHHLKFYIFVVVKSIFQFRLDNINLTNICFAITLLHKMWNKMANTLRGKSYNLLWKIIFITWHLWLIVKYSFTHSHRTKDNNYIRRMVVVLLECGTRWGVDIFKAKNSTLFEKITQGTLEVFSDKS